MDRGTERMSVRTLFHTQAFWDTAIYALTAKSAVCVNVAHATGGLEACLGLLHTLRHVGDQTVITATSDSH